MNALQLRQDVDFLCGSTSASYPDADKMRNINIAYNDVARIIWESSSVLWEDSSKTGQPVSYVTLGHTSAHYMIPTSAMKIVGIEVRNSAGDWEKLRATTYEELGISPEEYLSDPGMPYKYMIEGNDIRLFPSPSSASCALTTAMAIRLNSTVTDLPATATTASPGFASPFHRILSYAAVLDFTQDEAQRKNVLFQKERLERGLRNFYAKRVVELPATIKPASKRNWRKYT